MRTFRTPVALVATFAVQLALGYSINSLSLLALVLAVGAAGGAESDPLPVPQAGFNGRRGTELLCQLLPLITILLLSRNRVIDIFKGGIKRLAIIHHCSLIIDIGNVVIDLHLIPLQKGQD